MKFQRPQIVDHVFAGIAPSGLPHTTANITQTRVDDLVLGNGSSTWNLLQEDGKTYLTVTSVALPANYNANATFVAQIRDQSQMFLTVHTVVLGGGGLTGVKAFIEYNDPDHPEFWIPSKEGVARDAGAAANEFSLLGVGDWTVATRVEPMQAHLVRFRFKAAAGAADAATQIICSFAISGGQSMLTNQQP
jgi:hypothetical protein